MVGVVYVGECVGQFDGQVVGYVVVFGLQFFVGEVDVEVGVVGVVVDVGVGYFVSLGCGMRIKLFVIVGLLVFGVVVVQVQQVVVEKFWVCVMVVQQKVIGVFFLLCVVEDSWFVSVSLLVVGVVQIYEMVMQGDVMKMCELDMGLLLLVGKMVEFKFGGYYVMMMEFKVLIKVGDMVLLMLVFEGKDKKCQMVEVKVEVRVFGK